MKGKLGYIVLGVLSVSLIGILVSMNGNLEKEIALNVYANENSMPSVANIDENIGYQSSINEEKVENNTKKEKTIESNIIKKENSVTKNNISNDIKKENNVNNNIKKESATDELFIKKNYTNIDIIDTPIIKDEKVQLKPSIIPENNTVKLIDKSNGAYCAQAIEYFWQDANYRYYFTCIKSHNMYVLKNKQEYNLVYALKNKITTIEELENNGYRFLKESRNLQVK